MPQVSDGSDLKDESSPKRDCRTLVLVSNTGSTDGWYRWKGVGAVDDLDDLTLMWQSAPMRRDSAVGTVWGVGDSRKFDSDPQPLLELNSKSDELEASLEGLEAQICSMASRVDVVHARLVGVDRGVRPARGGCSGE